MKTNGNDAVNACTMRECLGNGPLVNVNYTGLTKRELFAYGAMKSLTMKNWSMSNISIGETSVMIADALIEALNKE